MLQTYCILLQLLLNAVAMWMCVVTVAVQPLPIVRSWCCAAVVECVHTSLLLQAQYQLRLVAMPK
jgi:hypothetical protein